MPDSVALKLGSLRLDVPYFQAPLSGYSDYSMRALARRFGCPFAMADMMLDRAASNPRVLRKACFRPGPDEHPVGAQIIGRTPAIMAAAARDLVAAGYDLIDLNFACPVPKVLHRRRGGAMLDDPDGIIDIFKAVRDVVACPILMKLRIGMDHGDRSLDYFWEIVTRSIEQGVDALVIHGRTVEERYRGKADWDLATAVKSRFPLATIIGSGDIFDAAATVELMKKTGLDGFVVARGAVGDPWIYRDLRCVWEGRPIPPPPDLAEQRRVMLEHLDGIMQCYPPIKAICRFRKFIVRYVRRHPMRKSVLMSLVKLKSRTKIETAINVWYADSRPESLR